MANFNVLAIDLAKNVKPRLEARLFTTNPSLEKN